MRVLLLGLAVLLSGCFYSLAGLDMSTEGRHKRWVEDRQSFLGQSIYRCLFGFCGDQKNPWANLYLGESELGGGILERGFRYGRFDKDRPERFSQCRYFFKYEAQTGVIVGFRYEESELYACRFSGA